MPRGAIGELTEAGVKRRVAASLMATGLSYKAALPMAGYSAKSEVYKRADFQETLEAARERLRGTDGYRLEDTLGWYKRMSEDGEIAPTVRLQARREMARLLGQEVPKKVEVNGRQEITTAVELLSRMDPALWVEILGQSRNIKPRRGVRPIERG